MLRQTPRFAATVAVSFALTFAAGACQKEKDKEGKDKPTADQGKANDGKQGAGKNVGKLHGGKGTTHTKKPKRPQVPPPADVAGPPADAKKTDSGLFYKVLKTADAAGSKPGLNDKVTVNYTGWTTDGNMFDTSQGRRSPAKFGVSRVIKGWTEGLQLMRQGESFRFWIPEELAYKGQSGPQGMLVFDVDLLEIEAGPKTPEDVAKPPADAKKTPLGVFYKVLKPGKGGAKPDAWDKVKVHYSGWTTDGKLFDSSIPRKTPSEFKVNRVIPGWTDALQQMSVGDKWRLWIPKEHAYDGAKGRPFGMLVFDVEMFEIIDQKEPPKAPADVKAPPKDAKKTELGVFYKILKSKASGAKPQASNAVVVHYTGWTTDGNMFDSSVTKGKPATLPLARVVPGWRDGLMQMKVGEKARLWIPQELAYKGRRPKGMLVFDIELIEIK